MKLNLMVFLFVIFYLNIAVNILEEFNTNGAQDGTPTKTLQFMPDSRNAFGN